MKTAACHIDCASLVSVNGVRRMNSNNKWELIRRGDAELGLSLMREDYNREPTPSHIVTLGVGYLWTEQYQSAWVHFQFAMQRYPFTNDIFFGMAAVAKWCIDETDAAVMSWKSGLEVQFADAAGGVHIPLLLWVASVLRPNSFSSSNAIQLLKKRVDDPRVKNWPGAIGQFVVNQIDELTLYERSTERISRKVPARQKWLIAFYKCVLGFERESMNLDEFKVTMQRMVDTSAPEWAEEGTFVQLLRNPEFYIARHEASRDCEDAPRQSAL
jgi:hypothetical protein